MRLIVSGKTKEFTPELEERFTAKISKLGKLIEQRGEREAHVTHQVERHLHRIEVVVNVFDHSLVGEGMNSDLDVALCEATEKLEKQIVKLKNKWRDTHRDPKGTRSSKESWDGVAPEPLSSKAAVPGTAPSKNGKGSRPKVFRVDYSQDRKPMTLDEAILEIERDRDEYVVYCDSARNCLSVLVRRPDGHLDLIES